MAEFAGRRESCGRVRRAGGARVVLLVARITERAIESVVVVNVAVGARARRDSMRTRQRKAGGGVVELAVGPQHGVVALLTCGREPGMRNRRGGAIVVSLVTADARRAGDVVVVVDVAIGTGSGWHGVSAAEWETGSAVVKGGI